jgi:hypothetical protein
MKEEVFALRATGEINIEVLLGVTIACGYYDIQDKTHLFACDSLQDI